MSQKSNRRGRRQTTEDDSASLKAPTPKPNGTEECLPPTQEEKTEEKAPTPPPEETPLEKENEKNEHGAVTRSRSATPQVKKMNGHDEENKEEEKEKNEEQKDEKSEEDEKEQEPEVEMDPLIVSDEPDPELVFEENSSDVESGKSSPILSRCKTRRSLTRNIPTPKTPKTMEDEEMAPIEETDGKEDHDVNQTFESCSENISTKAEAGGDSTRRDFDALESNSFLKEAKNKTFGETLRHLSTRRTIRPIRDDYRKRLLQNNLEKNDLSSTYPTRNSVERISSVGIKRKNRSESEEDFTKRFKSDSPGFFAKFTSPLASIRNPFRADLQSTPKLTSYKDEKCLIEDGRVNSKMCEVQDGERRWCSIM